MRKLKEDRRACERKLEMIKTRCESKNWRTKEKKR